MSYLHINYAKYEVVKLVRCHCPNCKRNTFFAAFYQPYYGWDDTCLKCGDGWQDEEMKERPFMRGWRKDRIASAKASYRKWREILTPTSEGNNK